MFKRRRGELPVVSVLLLIGLVVSTGSIVAVVFYSAVNQSFFSNEETYQNLIPQPVGTPTIKSSFSNFQKTSSLQGDYYDSFDISIRYTSGSTEKLYIFDVDVIFNGRKLDEFAEWEISETTAISTMDTSGEFTGYEQTKNTAYFYRVKLSDPFHTIARLPEQKFAFEITMGLTKGVPSYYYFGRYGETVTLESFVRPYNITLLGANYYHFYTSDSFNDTYLMGAQGKPVAILLLRMAIDRLNDFFETNYNTTLLNIIGEWTTTDGLLKIGSKAVFQGIPAFEKQQKNLNYPGDSTVINNTDILINSDWLINDNSQSLIKRAEANSIPMLFFGGSAGAQVQEINRATQYSGNFVKRNLTEQVTGVREDSFGARDSYPSGFCSKGTRYLYAHYVTSSNWTTSDSDLNALKSGITFSSTTYENPRYFTIQIPYTNFVDRGLPSGSVASFGGLSNKFECTWAGNLENHTYTNYVPSSVAVLKHKNETANTPAIMSMPAPNHLMGLGCPNQPHHYYTDNGLNSNWVRGWEVDLVNEIKEFFRTNWDDCLIFGRLVQNSIIYLLFGRQGYDAWLDKFESFTSKHVSSENKINFYQAIKTKSSFSDLSNGINFIENLQFKNERWLKPEEENSILQKFFRNY